MNWRVSSALFLVILAEFLALGIALLPVQLLARISLSRRALRSGFFNGVAGWLLCLLFLSFSRIDLPSLCLLWATQIQDATLWLLAALAFFASAGVLFAAIANTPARSNKMESKQREGTPPSLRTLKENLDDLLSDPVPKTVLLYGSWGVGKTHFWHHYSSTSVATSMRYVSLYGVESLQQLKMKIFASAGTIDSWCSKLGSWSSFFKFGPVAIPPEIFTAVAESRFEPCTICVDDLERRSPGLCPKDLFGFLTRLRDENSCNVVVIANIDRLDGEDLTHFKTHGEKTFNYRLEFSPSLDDNIKIGLQHDVSPTEKAAVKEVLRRLRTCNIRTIRNIDALYFPFRNVINHVSNSQQRHRCEHLAVLAVLYYEHGLTEQELSGTPWLASQLPSSNNSSNKAPNHPNKDIIQEAQFVPEDIDPFVFRYLQSGHLSSEDLQKCKQLCDTLDQRQGFLEQRANLLGNTWDTFSVSQDDVVSQVVEYLESFLPNLNLEEFSSWMTLLDKLGAREDLCAWNNRYVLQRLHDFSLDELSVVRTLPLPQETKDSLHQQRKNLLHALPISEVAAVFADPSGLSAHALEHLNAYDEEELRDYFLTAPYGGIEIKRFVDWLNSVSDPCEVQLIRKFHSVVSHLSKMSHLNSLRCKTPKQKLDQLLNRLDPPNENQL